MRYEIDISLSGIITVDTACKIIVILQKTHIGQTGAIGRNAITTEPNTNRKHVLVQQNMAVWKDVNTKEN